MHADAKHEEDDADLGKFSGKMGVRDHSWGERPNRNAREKIADERRQVQADSHKAPHKGKGQTDGNGEDQ